MTGDPTKHRLPCLKNNVSPPPPISDLSRGHRERVVQAPTRSCCFLLLNLKIPQEPQGRRLLIVFQRQKSCSKELQVSLCLMLLLSGQDMEFITFDYVAPFPSASMRSRRARRKNLLFLPPPPLGNEILNNKMKRSLACLSP